MTEATWNPSYSVGHPLLDEQHKKLLAICGRLNACSAETSEDSKWTFHELLNDLAEYAASHFRTEEALLQQHQYADLETHKNEHYAYEEHVALAAYEAISGNQRRAEACAFIQDWWLSHILESDMRYRGLFPL